MRFACPAMIKELDARCHVVIEASAGTGKTWTLEHLFIHLLVQKVNIEEILILTYTDKATRDMKKRLHLMLESIVHANASDPRVDPQSASVWNITSDIFSHLSNAFTRFEQISISTIHGFCRRMLMEYALEGRLSFQSSLVDPEEMFSLGYRQEIRFLLSKPSFLRDVFLSCMQSGFFSIERDLFSWYKDASYLSIVLDEAKVKEALCAAASSSWLQSVKQNHLASILGGSRAKHLKEKMHQYVESLHEIGVRFKRDKDLSKAVFDIHDARQVCFDDATRSCFFDHDGFCDHIDALLVFRLLHQVPSPFGILVHRLLPRIKERITKEKQKENLVDFDDMLRLFDEALKPPGGQELVSLLRNRYRFALVDEFQDTDELQWSILKRLFVRSTKEHFLYLIGDPKQAIYGFRSADVYTYHRALSELKKQGAVHLQLAHNYRSTKELINVFNYVFQHDFFEETTDNIKPLLCGDVSKKLEQGGKKAPSLVLWQLLSEHRMQVDQVRKSLASSIADEIQTLVHKQPLLCWSQVTSKPLSYEDIYVLTRNAHESNIVVHMLKKKGIPCSHYRPEGVSKEPEVEHLLAMLSMLCAPLSRQAQYRALLSPFFDISIDAFLPSICSEVQELLHARIQTLRRYAHEHDDGVILHSMMRHSGLIRRLLFFHSDQSLARYQAVIDLLLEIGGGRQGIHGLKKMLECLIEGANICGMEGHYLSLLKDRKMSHVGYVPSAGSAVQVLTIHKAKGLEAEVVFVAGGFSPGKRSFKNSPLICHQKEKREAWLMNAPKHIMDRYRKEQQEEEKRLLYVAITRAKSRIYLPYFGNPPPGCACQGSPYRFLSKAYACLDKKLETLVQADDTGDVVYRVLSSKVHSLRALHDADSDDKIHSIASFIQKQGNCFEGEKAVQELDEAVFTPFVWTSYSAIKNRQENLSLPYVDHEEKDDSLSTEMQEHKLPGGLYMGLFFHQVLEHLDFQVLIHCTDLKEWVQKPSISSLFESSAEHMGIDFVYIPYVQETIYRALRQPQQLGSFSLSLGLASLEKTVREMPFVYPIPELFHPCLAPLIAYPQKKGFALDDQKLSNPYRAKRGMIRGVIDLVFELNGRIFFLDYKSDMVSGEESLRDYAANHYALQSQLYTLAIVRLLGMNGKEDYERRFGGMVYAFLRNMDKPNQGLVYSRPSFEDVMDFDRHLRREEYSKVYTTSFF